MKIFLIVVVVLVVGLAGVGIFLGPSLLESLQSMAPTPTGTGVRIQKAEHAPLVESVSAPGFVEPLTKVDISAEVSARIIELPFREGQMVNAGDVIVRLEDDDLRAALDMSEARRDGEESRLASERARHDGIQRQLDFARREFDRMSNLHETGDVSRKSYDDAEERVQSMEATADAASHSIMVIEASLEGAKADIVRAQEGLDNTVIAAPMSGLIIDLDMEVGEQVLGTFNNVGTRIMTIADMSRMVLMAEVAESDIASIANEQTAKIFINAYPDDVFEGVVTQIALRRSVSNDGTGIFEVEVELAALHGKRIRSGLAANVDIDVAAHEGLALESQAIVERLVEELPDEVQKHDLVDRSKRTTSVVYRIVDDKAVCTPVRTGASDMTQTIVVEGIDAGDVVVIGPYKVLEKISDGELVHDQDAESDESDGTEGDEAETGVASDDSDAAPGADGNEAS